MLISFTRLAEVSTITASKKAPGEAGSGGGEVICPVRVSVYL